MKYQGVVFDFNGTLFWDTPYHNQAWDCFLEQHRIQMDDQTKYERIHGKNNADILTAIFNRRFDPAKLTALALQKEAIYQKICLQTQMKLAPGVEEFLACLIQKRVPYTIATSSGPENVEFYFRYLQLDKWFKRETIVFNDGSLGGKPAPDLFLAAIKQLGLKPAETVIFEDSFSGIKAAENAQAGQIVIVNSTQSDYSQWPYPVITDFHQVERLIEF